jgi:hypothetical protein
MLYFTALILVSYFTEGGNKIGLNTIQETKAAELVQIYDNYPHPLSRKT